MNLQRRRRLLRRQIDGIGMIDTSRVLFSISVPGKGKAAARFDGPVSLIDLYPMLTEVCGQPLPNTHCFNRIPYTFPVGTTMQSKPPAVRGSGGNSDIPKPGMYDPFAPLA